MQSERVSADFAGSKTARFTISKGKTTFKVKASKKCTIYVKATSKANKNRKAGTKTVKIVVR